MLQHVWSLGLSSTSVVCHDWRMMTCTGWLFLRGWSTSSPWGSTWLQDISPTKSTVCLCLKFPFANIYDLPDVVNCLFHESTCSPQHIWETFVFQSPEQQSDFFLLLDVFRYPAVDSEHNASLVNTSIHWRLKSVSALGVFYVIELYKSSLAYVLTYLLIFRLMTRELHA